MEQQKAFADYIMEVMGIDRGHCGLGETEHPFTLEFNNKDVRITTHYDLHNVASSMYSVLHEGGHALYELGIRDDLQYTCLAGGVSMGVHESQSRFYENLIGRSRAFLEAIYPRVQAFFPEQLGGGKRRAVLPGREQGGAEPHPHRVGRADLLPARHGAVRDRKTAHRRYAAGRGSPGRVGPPVSGISGRGGPQ